MLGACKRRPVCPLFQPIQQIPCLAGRGFFILRFYIVSGTLTLNIVRML